MSRKNNSSEQLHAYFKIKQVNINLAAQETGISKPTISRYIRSQGYESYAHFLHGKHIEKKIQSYDLLKEIKKYQQVYVTSSRSSILLKEYMIHKLNGLGINAQELVGSIDKKALIIFLSLSGSSRSLEKTVEEYKNKIICISTIKPIIVSNNLQPMIVNEANYGRSNKQQMMMSIDGLIDFIRVEIK